MSASLAIANRLSKIKKKKKKQPLYIIEFIFASQCLPSLERPLRPGRALRPRRRPTLGSDRCVTTGLSQAVSGARPGSAWPPPSSPVLVAHGAPPDAGPAQEHAAPGAHAVAAALARGPPVQQQPQRPPAAGARPLFVLLAQALAARPAEMLQLRLQTPVAQGVKPEDSVE